MAGLQHMPIHMSAHMSIGYFRFGGVGDGWVYNAINGKPIMGAKVTIKAPVGTKRRSGHPTCVAPSPLMRTDPPMPEYWAPAWYREVRRHRADFARAFPKWVCRKLGAENRGRPTASRA